jgi:hypothetical protein
MKKVNILFLSAVILAGIETGVRADGCILDCVNTSEQKMDNCKTFYSNDAKAQEKTLDCLNKTVGLLSDCLKNCPIS